MLLYRYNGFDSNVVYQNAVALHTDDAIERAAEFDGCQMSQHVECDGKYDVALFQFQRDAFYAHYSIWWQNLFDVHV